VYRSRTTESHRRRRGRAPGNETRRVPTTQALRWREGWRASAFRSSKLLSASERTSSGNALYRAQNRGEARCLKARELARRYGRPRPLARAREASQRAYRLRFAHPRWPSLALGPSCEARQIPLAKARESAAQCVRLCAGHIIPPTPRRTASRRLTKVRGHPDRLVARVVSRW
jgi:hypothetical protein